MAAKAEQHSYRDEQCDVAAVAPELRYPQALAPFLRQAPLTVLVRSCLEWMVERADLETLFEETAHAQYTRQLTLDFLVDLMLDVVCGIAPSAHAALKSRREQMGISRQAFYSKLQRMELPVSAAIVARFAELAGPIMEQCHFAGVEPIPGYAARVLDGTIPGGRTDHRIGVLHPLVAGGLTGKVLAVYAVAQHLVQQVVLDEDAYVQERALVNQVQVRAGEVWLGDRNFCVRTFLFRLHEAGAAFVMRWHAQCPYEEIAPLAPAQDSTQGALEQPVHLTHPDTGAVMAARRIVLPLDTPTRHGDRELILMTDLPQSVSADVIGEGYRQRWQIETHFQKLTSILHCEPDGLNHPRAALFAFAMAVVAGNALAVVQAALQVVHGEDAVREMSYYAFVLHISQIWAGMAIAVPDKQWTFVRNASLQTLALWLLAVARQVPMKNFRRSVRGQKKKPPKKQSSKNQTHVSNKRLIELRLHSPIHSH